MNRDPWRIKTSLAAMMLAALAFSSAVNAQQAALSEDDQEFITTAAQSSHAEVAMGKKAAESQNPAIREFGNQMVTEHTQMNDDLAALAKQKGVTLPSSPDLGSQAKDVMMNVLPGKTWDSQYVSSQLDDHQETLELLQEQAQSGQDPDLKSFAQKYIPVIQEHLDEAKELQKRPELQ